MATTRTTKARETRVKEFIIRSIEVLVLMASAASYLLPFNEFTMEYYINPNKD